MALFLGIDGGGTGCRAAICDAAGQILGEGQGGPANITSDLPGARANILAATEAALPAGTAMADLRAVLGLAGANVAATAARLAADLPFASARVETDALIAVKGALRDADGIVAAIGTGSVFVRQAGGALRRIGGWGLVLGDEGSGAWIGRAMLAETLRALDGFVPMTSLTAALLAEMGGTDGIVEFARTARPVDFAALAPRVAASPDPAAQSVMARAGAEVMLAVDLLQNGAGLPVVFLGGLGAIFAERFGDRWPLLPPQGSALDGALWLARQGG